MEQAITLRKPTAEDGMLVHQLISECPPLDTNSSYCNLLQCAHFADTSIAAFSGQELVGFVSGYPLPSRPDTLFVWQVAISKSARGQGLATKMLTELVQRSSKQGVCNIETTITDENKASWALFESLANKLSCQLSRSMMFDCVQHFSGQHDSELLAKVGPF